MEADLLLLNNRLFAGKSYQFYTSIFLSNKLLRPVTFFNLRKNNSGGTKGAKLNSFSAIVTSYQGNWKNSLFYKMSNFKKNKVNFCRINKSFLSFSIVKLYIM